MVLIEAVKDRRPRLFAVNPHPLVVDLARQTGLDLVVVRGKLSPELARLNDVRGSQRTRPHHRHPLVHRRGGKLPLRVRHHRHGRGAFGQRGDRGGRRVPVNHQYSKSLDFDGPPQLISTAIDPDIVYASGLRPYSELAIARAFARLTATTRTFCSCNTVFRRSAGRRTGGAATAPSAASWPSCWPRSSTGRRSPTSSGAICSPTPTRWPGFAALMSDDDKPFECVGERRESAAALRILSSLPAVEGRPGRGRPGRPGPGPGVR
jgi:hypothetical protein